MKKLKWYNGTEDAVHFHFLMNQKIYLPYTYRFPPTQRLKVKFKYISVGVIFRITIYLQGDWCLQVGCDTPNSFLFNWLGLIHSQLQLLNGGNLTAGLMKLYYFSLTVVNCNEWHGPYYCLTLLTIFSLCWSKIQVGFQYCHHFMSSQPSLIFFCKILAQLGTKFM